MERDVKSIEKMRQETERKLREAEKQYEASVKRILDDRGAVPDFRPEPVIQPIPDHGPEIAALLDMTRRIAEIQVAPKEVIRDKDTGRMVGVKVKGFDNG
jgi:hypothetical protein